MVLQCNVGAGNILFRFDWTMARNAKSPQPSVSNRNLWVGLILLLVGVGLAFWFWRNPERHSEASVGKATTGLAQPAGMQSDAVTFAAYAGSESCRECHAPAYSHWASSHHALAERPLNLSLDQAAFDPVREVKPGSQTSQARFVQGQFQIVTAGPGGQHKPFSLERAIGVEPLRQYLAVSDGGRFQVTELAFDPRRGDWFDVFGAEDRQPGEWGHWTGRGMTWNQMCASCHNTRLRKNYDAAADRYTTAMAERGVGCEACHGPMKTHVLWQKERPQPARGDPTLLRLARPQMMETCGSCHARRGELTGDFHPGERFLDHYLLSIPDETDLYYADGQVREENYEYTSFLSSRMSAAGVTCLDCHEPHSGKTLAADNTLCQRCHGPPIAPAPKIDAAMHSHHPPNAAGGRCVECHMPRTTYMQRHPRRDHGFPIPDPWLTQQHGIPNACNRCHLDRDSTWSLAAVENWFGERMNRPSRTRAQTIAKTRAGETNVVPDLLRLAREEKIPLWRATATRFLERWAADSTVTDHVLERVGDADPLVRVQAAHALAGLMELSHSKALNSLRFLLSDSTRAVRLEAAWALRSTLETNSVAGRDLLHSLAFNADQPAGAMQFGVFLMERNLNNAALEWFQRAVNWDGHSAPLREALAVALSSLGRTSEAVRELETACRLAPKEAPYRYKLGLALNEAGKATAAVTALEEAVKLDPQLAQAWYNLGLGYSALERPEEALQALARAESIDSASARIPYARATVLAQLGRTEEARRAAGRALEIQPGYPEAASLLNALARNRR